MVAVKVIGTPALWCLDKGQNKEIKNSIVQ